MPDDDPFLAEVIQAQEPVPEDRLLKLRATLDELRAKQFERTDLEARLEALGKEINRLEQRDLVNQMVQCRLKSLDLEAEGNYPAGTAKLQDFFSAKIPEGGEKAAFGFLEEEGYGDNVRNTVQIDVEKDELRKLVIQFLEEHTDLDYIETRKVHPQTLLRIVRELHNKGRMLDTETTHPTTLLGAYIGSVVKFKPLKGESK